jgi:hypothetical protein
MAGTQILVDTKSGFLNGYFMQPQRCAYSKSFMTQVIQECAQPGASIASIALSISLNANLIHKWIRVTVVADRGYYKGLEIFTCEQARITTFVPKPLTSGCKATLCSDCNNRVLGAELDPTLIDVYRAASAVLDKGRFPVVEPIQLTGIYVNKVARAVAGHLIALDYKAHPRHRMIRRLRRFVL